MKHKFSNGMLLAGALLLGGFILVFERGAENSEQHARRERTVFEVSPETIDRIQLERDGTQIECTKTAGIWRLTKPADAPVDSGMVEQMIAGMAGVERGELITAETLKERNLTPSDYGFDTPRARITFKNNRGTFTWLIGRDAPVGKSLYVMQEGGGSIIAAPQTLLNLIPQDPAWIRDRIVFTGEPSAVRGLDLRRPGGFLQLRQPEKNGWLMQQPLAARADIQAVHALIGKLFAARIAAFVTDEKSDLTVYGLDKPAYELTLFFQNESTQTLLIGATVPEHPDTCYAKRIESDSVFTVPAEWIKEMQVDKSQLRNRFVIGLPAERISGVQLIHGDRQVELIRSNHVWQVIRPVRWNADPKKTAEVLNELTGAVIEEFVEPLSAEQSAQLQSPAWSVILTADGKTNTVYASEPGDDGRRLIQDSNPPSFYTAKESFLRDAFADPLFYRSATVLEVNPGLIEKITVKNNGTERSVGKANNGTFTAEQPDYQVNSQALTDLMWELNDFRAARYVDFNPESLAPYGLDQPQVSLTVTLSDTNVIGRMILLGNQTSDGRFAMIQGQNIVFVVSEKTVQTLTSKLTVPIEKQAEESNPL
jgi:hypothetical protein